MRNHRVQRGRSLIAIAALTSLLVMIPVTDAAAQTISVSPDAGPTGTTVTVSGSGFTSGFPPCRIEFEITPDDPASRV